MRNVNAKSIETNRCHLLLLEQHFQHRRRAGSVAMCVCACPIIERRNRVERQAIQDASDNVSQTNPQADSEQFTESLPNYPQHILHSTAECRAMCAGLSYTFLPLPMINYRP